MGMFESLNKLTNRMKDALLLNQNILKLVYYPNKTPLNNNDVDNARDLINDYIYFYPIAFDDVIQEEKCLIMSTFDISPTYGKNNYVNMNFTFVIIAHNRICEIEIDNEERNRVTSICDEITEEFNRARGNWLGGCSFKGFNEIYIAQDYYSVKLSFSVTDFKM